MEQTQFEWNMASLRGRFPNLAEAINQVKYREDDAMLEVSRAQDGTMILQIRKDGRKLYVNGPRNPREPVRREIERWGTLRRETPVCLVGMADMVFLREVLENTDDTTHIIVYEPSLQIFLEMLHKVDIRDIFEKRALGLVVEGLNREEAEGILNSCVTPGNYTALKQWTSLSYREFFPQQVLKFLTEVERRVTAVVAGRNTDIRYAGVKAGNIFHNLKYLCDGYITTQLCQVVPRDIPGILVSAGPSLNKNIQELKRAKNRAFIVAVDTAVKPLVKAGILPDLYMIVDGKKPLDLLDFEEARRIPMCPSITSASDILEQHTGMKFFYREGVMLSFNVMIMNGIPIQSVSCGGSVACSGFSLLYKMGFQRIILVGQDLALTGNKSHADGTFREKMEELDTSRCMKVPGNYEKEVPTRMDFKLYLDWFNYYIKGCQGVHVINATEGGARIENTEVMTLGEAIDRECGREVDIASCMAKLKPALDREGRKRAVEYLNTVPEMFRNLKRKAVKERLYYGRLDRMCEEGRADKKEYASLLKKIQKLTGEIECHELYPLITETIAVANALIMEQEFCQEEDFKTEGREIARQGVIFMEQVQKCIDLLLPLSEETLGKLQ